jgi:hypothetical protein
MELRCHHHCLPVIKYCVEISVDDDLGSMGRLRAHQRTREQYRKGN